MTRHTATNEADVAEVNVQTEPDGQVLLHIKHDFAEASASMRKGEAYEIGKDLIDKAGRCLTAEPLQIGEIPVRVSDCLAIGFSTEKTVASVGLIGYVTRVRRYDETYGNPIAEPQIWIKDERTSEIVGPLTPKEIDGIIQLDGPWLTDAEVQAML